MSGPLVLAVDGIDGSGKSTFAARLAAACGRRGLAAVVLRVDDFRRPVDFTRRDRAEADLYYEDYYDLPLLDSCLRTRPGEVAEVEVPCYDPVRECLAGTRRLSLQGAALAIVEGVFPLRLPAVAAGWLVYLETSFEIARRRIIARDQRKGRTLAEIERRIERRYFPGQHRYHATLDPRRRAHVVIDNQDPGAPRLVRCALGPAPAALEAAIRELVASPTAGPA